MPTSSKMNQFGIWKLIFEIQRKCYDTFCLTIVVILSITPGLPIYLDHREILYDYIGVSKITSLDFRLVSS